MDLEKFSDQELKAELKRRELDDLRKEYDQIDKIRQFVLKNQELFEAFYLMLNGRNMPDPWESKFEFNVFRLDTSKYYGDNCKLKWETNRV